MMSLLLMVLLGLAIGVLSSGTGLGGGFLVVPFLIYLGKEAKNAVGTSFFFVLLVAVSSLIAHFRLGHVDLKTGFILAIGGILGAQIGPVFLTTIPDHIFKRGFALLMVSVGVWMFVNAKIA